MSGQRCVGDPDHLWRLPTGKSALRYSAGEPRRVLHSEPEIRKVPDSGFEQWEELCADIWRADFRNKGAEIQTVEFGRKRVFHSHILRKSLRPAWLGNRQRNEGGPVRLHPGTWPKVDHLVISYLYRPCLASINLLGFYFAFLLLISSSYSVVKTDVCVRLVALFWILFDEF